MKKEKRRRRVLRGLKRALLTSIFYDETNIGVLRFLSTDKFPVHFILYKMRRLVGTRQDKFDVKRSTGYKISHFKLESLILAQNERWRQA